MDELCTTGKFEELCKVLFINSGGCAIAMLAIYRYLKKKNLLKGDEKFVYLYGEHDPYLEINQKYLKGEVHSPVSCDHAVLFHNGKLWDSNGIFNNWYENLQKLDANKYESFVVNSINNRDVWNSLFNRKVRIPQIEKILGVNLKDIER